ncbi:aa3-type cytochrome c oxidase subunit IV [Sphingomonas sp. ID1715]|nr:aa3-type cytochrome c oxidase subunit IV [Sphingomonas sp. ID1715]NNM75604.1 aa3-type cytochrome c oxidase subunit IV [Sphingomonas sp. ID1715]
MAQNGEIKAHEQTYSGFTALLKWGTVASFIVAFIVVLLIAG